MGLFFIIVAVVISLLEIFISKKPRTKTRVLGVFLLNYLIFVIGATGIMGFMGHAFMADQIAESIGWPTGNPFQFEVAAANLAVGVAGIMCIWFRGNFWLAAIVTNGIFLFVDGIGHINQIITAHDYAPNNAGIILYTDLIMPIVGIILYILHIRSQKSAV